MGYKGKIMSISENKSTIPNSKSHMFFILDLFSFSAIESNFSPDNNSSIDTEKNFDISFNESIFGYPLPDSHFETAVLDTYKASANSSCVSPFFFPNS